MIKNSFDLINSVFPIYFYLFPYISLLIIIVNASRFFSEFRIFAPFMNDYMEVKIINRSGNPLPSYSTSHSAGMDVRAFLPEDIILKPLERKLVPTGLYLEIPEGFEAQIRPRSGLAIRHGITVLNTPGTIDADYRGEVCIILVNLSSEEFTVKNGDRICQMIIASHEKVDWKLTEDLETSGRGDGGFGHTGKN
jgi:dUTP pyrophosphatase